VPGPLAGIRVVDLTRGVTGPYATKLLADYGADVLKVEPPDGDPTRSYGPFRDDVAHPERSGLFLHLNTNKRSFVLDAASPEAAVTIARLAADADVLVEDFAPGEAEANGWGWETLRAANPALVMASITAFGQSGPYRDYRGSDLTLQAIGGPLDVTGHRDREPLKLAGNFASHHAGLTAALAIMLARYRVERGGEGDHIDISIYECQAGSRDRRTTNLTVAAYTGIAPRRSGSTAPRLGAGVRACADGFVNLMGAGNRLPSLLKLIGRDDLIGDPGLDVPVARISDDLYEQIEGSYRDYLAGIPKLQAVAEAQELGILAGAIMRVSDLVADPHYRDRGVWDSIDHPEAGTLEYPGRPFVMSDSPRPQPQRAPLLGEHNSEVEEQLASSPEPPPATSDTPPTASLPLPLEGVRVASITVVWAGPHAGQLLAEWGADVIRVEPVNKIQPFTRGAEATIPRAIGEEMAKRGTPTRYPDLDPGDEPWNRNASFNSHARNKRSMACDIMSPEGREAFLRLIEQCDVLIENNVPETIDKANIGWDELRAVNPRLIMLRMPAFGLSGPYSGYRAFGLHVEGMVGHTHLRGYPDAGPEVIGETLASDAVSGVQGALAVMMALRHREQTGRGQLIELPLTESFIPTLAEFVFDYTMKGRDMPSQGNRHRWNAPHNVYRCTGDDNWIAIDVATDAEFAALCDLLDSDLASDPRFGTSEARRAHLDALDDAISALTAGRDKEQLFHELQAVGVCAAPVHDALEALADPQLEARGFFEELETPTAGTHRYPGLMFRMAQTPNALRTPPVRLGEHNEQIYLDLLGYEREQYDALVDAGLVGTRYPESLIGHLQR
jgi:crotonobetainyl-CoA:carnitine CoA-transferase CaiB-like acyl-CoA transferase